MSPVIVTMDRRTYYSASELKRLGLTQRQVASLTPDEEIANPYGYPGRMKLFVLPENAKKQSPVAS
jgi:hypothetical protein